MPLYNKSLYKKGDFVENDPHYANCQLLIDKSSSKTSIETLPIQCLVKRGFASMPDLDEQNSLCQKFQSQHCPYVLNLLAYDSQTTNQSCQASFASEMLFEYSNHTLWKEMTMVRQKQTFDNSFHIFELYDLLLNCLTALKYFVDYAQVYHGDLCLSNILMSHDLKTFKLLYPKLILEKPNGYERFLMDKGQTPPESLYLAPELVDAGFYGQISPTIDQTKTEIFSLGVCALKAALLNHQAVVYDESYQFNTIAIKQYLAAITYKYDKEFAKILAKMLSLNPSDRPNIDNLILTVSHLRDQSEDLFYTAKPPLASVQSTKSKPLRKSKIFPPKQVKDTYEPPSDEIIDDPHMNEPSTQGGYPSYPDTVPPPYEDYSQSAPLPKKPNYGKGTYPMIISEGTQTGSGETYEYYTQPIPQTYTDTSMIKIPQSKYTYYDFSPLDRLINAMGLGHSEYQD